jgi:hypothetical protein
MLSASLLLLAVFQSPVPAPVDSDPPKAQAIAPSNSPSANDDPAYERTIEKRAQDVLTALHLNDPSKAARVHDTMIAQYRALNAWHDANDARLGIRFRNAAEKKTPRATPEEADHARSELKALHDQFLARLAADLTPEQVEQVEDKMTYGKVAVTYNAYLEIVPGLTDAEKAHILALLKDAREQAIDGGSEKEKSAIFKKYKGKINVFLTADGHDVSKAYKEWGERQKEKSAK